MASTPSFDDLLQCSICLERFTRPKVLPCQHTFCLSCLKGFIKDAKTVDCPTCRRTHQVPEQGPAGFHDNLMAANFLSMFGESNECADCRDKQVLSECEHCKRQVCADCRTVHNVLRTEISIQIQSIKNNLQKFEDADAEVVRSNLEKTQQVQNDVNRAFDEAVSNVVACLNARRAEFVQKVEFCTKFQDALARNEKVVVIQEALDELSNCYGTKELRRMKLSLAMVEKTTESENIEGPEFSFDLTELTRNATKFGVLSFSAEMLDGSVAGEVGGGETVGAVGGSAVAEPFLLQSSNTETHQNLQYQSRGQLSRFPSGVDYAGKVDAWRLVISKAAAGCEELKPTCAVYSQTDSALYCLSAGKLLRYDHKSGAGAIVSNTVTASHLALTDSGAVMFIDGCNIVKVTADTRVKSNVDAAYYSFTNMNLNCTKPTQICCHGKEFVILDAGKKCLLKFREDGKLIGEIKSDELVLGEKSRMCVDGKGRIYVSEVRIKERKNSHKCYSCTFCKTPKTATVIWSFVITMFSWEGEECGEIALEAGSQWFGWNYGNWNPCPQPCYRSSLLRDNRVSDEQLRCDLTKHSPPVISLCVDGDGYLILTRAGRHQVDVYNPDHEHHVTIDWSLNEPTGVSLTPDGKLVVCDTGNNRIQII